MNELPDDIILLIYQHKASMIIQQKWRDYHYFKHTKHSLWSKLKIFLNENDLFDLQNYSMVRREWVTEPSSWLTMSPTTAKCIRLECQCGLWGKKRNVATST